MARYYDAPRARSHRADPRRGRGHAHASDTPKVLHPICGRPMIGWPVRAAQEAGAGRIVVVDGPQRRLEGELPDGVEIAVQEEPNGTGDAVRSAAGPHRRATTPCSCSMGDVPLITAEAISRARAGARGERRGGDDGDDGARGPDGLRARDPRRRRQRRARRRDEDAGRRDPRGGGDPRGQHGHLRVRGRRPRSTRSGGSPPTTPRASSTCPTCCRSCAPTASSIAAHVVTDATLTLGVNNRVDLARVRALAQARIHARARPRRRDDRGPAEHARSTPASRSAATR